jgi:hypothetical protein
MISEQGVRVDGTSKALRVAEVRLTRNFRVESGGETRKYERVHLHDNEGKAKNTKV